MKRVCLNFDFRSVAILDKFRYKFRNSKSEIVRKLLKHYDDIDLESELKEILKQDDVIEG